MATAIPADSGSYAARVERLRSVAAQLERSPRSQQRDAVLHAVRARVVTLDTGNQHPSAWRSTPRPVPRPVDLAFGLLDS